MHLLRTLFAACCSALLITASSHLLHGCSSTPPLTDEEMAKLHPQVQRLLAGEAAPDLDSTSTLRSDGVREFELIVRSANPDELRSIGITPQSQFGDVLTVRVSTEEIVKVARLQSVIAIEPGSKNYPH